MAQLRKKCLQSQAKQCHKVQQSHDALSFSKLCGVGSFAVDVED